MDWIREEWSIRKLQKGEAKEQVEAAKRLGDLQSCRAIPLLFEIYRKTSRVHESFPRDFNKELRVACMGSLLKIACKAQQDVALALIQALHHDSVDVRAYACNLLLSMGSASMDAVPALRGLLRDSEPTVSQAAARALRFIQGDAE